MVGHWNEDFIFQIRAKFPDRIVVFRDGGSMGAMEQIAATEMKSIKLAIDNTTKEPVLFSFVVVNKRIRQRFFAKQVK